MSLAVLAPHLSSRSGPATLRSRLAQSFLGAAVLVLAMACGGGGGGGGGSTTPVIPPPVATSLTASSPAPAYGSTFTLTPVYSAGTGVIDHGVTCPATGVASAAITANWSGARTFTLTVTNSANAAVTATAVVTPQVVAVASIDPATPTVTVSTTKTFTTTVTGGATNAVIWSSTAGTWSGNVWTAPSTPGPVTITATSTDDSTKTATTVVTVEAAVAPPVATSLTASTATPAYGATFTLTPIYSGGTGTIDNGVTCPTSGTASAAVTANWTGDRTFTLTVDNGAGLTDTKSVTVTPQVVSVGAISPANPTKSVSTATTFSSVVTGGALNTVTWTASAGSFTGNVWTAPPAAGPVTITATSDDDPTKTITTTVTVVDAPQIATFAPAAARVALNGNTTLAATFTGGTGSVNQNVGAILGDGTTVPTGTLAATTVFTLTVTNAANDSVTATATVTVGNDLTVNITGLGSLDGSVDVTGPNSFSQTLTADQTFNGLADGLYTITANTITDPGQPGLGGALGDPHLQRYPAVRVQTVTLNADGQSYPATAAITANYPPAILNVIAGSTSIDLVLVPGGTFEMGETAADVGPVGSEPAAQGHHSVTFAKAFYVAKVPVTQAQWEALMPGNPSDYKDLTFPVTNVSFDNITAPGTGFLDVLNAAASAKPAGSTFHLPTDAEYEYATRAGTTTNFYFGAYDTGIPADQLEVDKYVWSNNNSAGAIHPVGGRLPNAWGLYDMSGLIWQLCADDWHADYTVTGIGVPTLPIDGSAWVDSPRVVGRVFRGGSWAGAPWQAQSKVRGPYDHDDVVENNAGFRVVLQLP